MRLGEYFAKIIAERDGIKPEEVTEKYLLKKREERKYYPINFESSDYGGYEHERLEYIPLKQQEEDEKEVEKFLAEFA